MGILLLTLKIIGILLAVLMLLAITMVAVPVRYHASLKVQDRAEGNATFHWLFHTVDLRLWYSEEGISWKCRILGVPAFRQKEGNGKPKKGKKVKSLKREDSAGLSVSEESEPSKEQAKKRVIESIQKEHTETVDYEREQDQKGIAQPSQGRNETIKSDEVEQSFKAEGQNSFKGENMRIYHFFSKVPEQFQKLKSIIQNGELKFSALKARFLNIKTMLLDETNQKAFLHILQELKCLLKHFSPRKASGNIDFAMGDPAQTGLALGMLSILPFWANYQISVTPDFMAESFYMRGTLFLKGYIRIWHLLPSLVRLIKDKNIHRLIAAMRR